MQKIKKIQSIFFEDGKEDQVDEVFIFCEAREKYENLFPQPPTIDHELEKYAKICSKMAQVLIASTTSYHHSICS